MTPEEVKKAVVEAAAPFFAPLEERLSLIEEMVLKADSEQVEGAGDTNVPENLTLDAVQKMVAETVTGAVAPIVKRLEAVETASGQRQSGMEEQGAHTVRKADGSFSWEGSGLLL